MLMASPSVELIQSLMSMAVGAASLLFLLCYAVFLFWLSPMAARRRLTRNGLRGPPPVFPLGNLMEMMTTKKRETSSSSSSSLGLSSYISHDTYSSVFSYFARWRRTYGKVFVYWLGTEPFLYVADPEFLRRATAGVLEKKWGKPDVFKRDRYPLFGSGLLMAEGDAWAHHRNIVFPAFLSKNLNAMIKPIEESAMCLIDEWSRHLSLGRHEIDVQRDITRIAAEIIAKTSFSLCDANSRKLFEKMRTLQAVLFKTNRLVGVPFSWLLYPKQTYVAWKLGKEIDRLLLAIANARRSAAARGDAARQDILGLLLAEDHENAQGERKLTMQELVDECKTFYFGGHETTAVALSWTLLLLAVHPEWQSTVREEVMRVSNGAPLDLDVLSKLTKMEWVWNEVTRLYSPAPNLQRQAREDIEVGDMVIPRGTNMWVDSAGMHHDGELWGDDVNEFRPERFKEDAHGGCRQRMGFVPFGFGGRFCVGKNLSAMEYKIVLSLILRRFSLSVWPGYRHSPRVMFIFRPSHGVRLILRHLDQ